MRHNILSDKRFFVLVAFSLLMVSTAFMVKLGRANPEELIPDWTSVTHDFFTLSPGTANPVLTKADVTDKANVTFVADPFLFHEGSTWYMFFEICSNGALLDSDIGLATSSDGFQWTYQQVVLDETFHVSYPQVFKWNGTYYMVPETYTENQVKLYRATNFPYTWTLVANIVSGPVYLDSSIFRYNNAWWLFTSDGWSTYLYYSGNLTDPSSWHAHPMNPIISGDPSKARSGGRVTVFNATTIIRLAQKNDVVYGQAVRAFQVDTLTTTSYAEHEIPQSPIVQASGSGWNKDGMHTVDPWWIGNRWLVAVDGVNYSPSEVWSIGIYESPVLYSLTTSTNYGTVSPPSGLYDPGSTVTITATPPAAGPGERYVFLGWTGSGVGSYTGLANPASVTMNDNITETASWKIQYFLTVSSAYDSPSPTSGWFDSGSSITASVASPVSGGSGTQYVCSGWSGTGSVPASGSASAVTFTISAPSTITWNWKTQYYLTVTSTYGTASGAGWYDSGASAYATVSPLAVAGSEGTQYVFTGWSGDASGATSPSNAIAMDGPKTATANWKTQYFLTVTSTYGTAGGAGWYDSGVSAFATVSPLAVAGPEGTQYVFTGWSGDASGATSPSNAIAMDGPKTATANWKTQYLVTVTQSGVGSDFSGTVVTVNGTGYDRAGFAAWANTGDVYTFSYAASPLVAIPNGKQYLLTGVSGNSTASSLTVSGSVTVIGAYKAQCYLTVSSAYDSPSPSNGWFDSGSTITGSVASPVSGGSGTQYVCAGWSGTGSVPASGSVSAVTFTIGAPSTITWNWKTQYYLTVTSTYGTAGGAGWYDSGASAYATVSPLAVAGANGTQYAFSSWGGAASGTNSQSNPIVMNAAATATAIYKLQYYINVTSAHGDPTPSAWVDAGKAFSVSVTSPADTVPDDHRFVCTGYSVDGGATKTGTSYDFSDVKAAHTIVFNWKQQFWVVFKQEGLPEGLTANVTINSVTRTLPYAAWFDQGATVEFTYDNQLPSGFGTQYVSSTSIASPLKVESSIDVESSYANQYTAEMYAVIAVPIILVCLAVAILLLRRRRRKPTKPSE